MILFFQRQRKRQGQGQAEIDANMRSSSGKRRKMSSHNDFNDTNVRVNNVKALQLFVLDINNKNNYDFEGSLCDFSLKLVDNSHYSPSLSLSLCLFNSLKKQMNPNNSTGNKIALFILQGTIHREPQCTMNVTCRQWYVNKIKWTNAAILFITLSIHLNNTLINKDSDGNTVLGWWTFYTVQCDDNSAKNKVVEYVHR